jgi:hypothetical protein
MASRVDYAVSATPIYSYTPAGEGAAVDVIATDVGKSIGGSGNSTVTWGSTGGFTGGSPAYASTADTITCTSAKFIYLKHTGYVYSSPSALGAVTTANLTVKAGGVTIAVLEAGGSIVLPLYTATTVVLTFTASASTIAVEYFWTA